MESVARRFLLGLMACALNLVVTRAEAQVIGDASGIATTAVLCRNLTTGQTVISSSSRGDWDCAALGLVYSPGDRLQTGTRGVLPSTGLVPGVTGQTLPEDFASHIQSDASVFGGPVWSADLDGDGDLDAVVRSAFLWMENPGGPNPLFVKHLIDGPEGSARTVHVMDVNLDGRLDIVASFAGNSQKLLWFENDGATPTGFVERRIDSRPGWTVESVDGGDLDGDGDTDFFAVMEKTQCEQPPPFLCEEVVWIEDVGASYVRHTIELEEVEGDHFTHLVAFDADGDLDLDLMLADHSLADTVTWYENEGGSFDQEHMIDASNQPFNLHVTDVDGDGDDDIVASKSGTGDEVRWYENQGGGVFVIRTATAFAEHDSLAVGDVSADGHVDIVLARGNGPLAWLENDGESPPAFELHEVDGTAFTQLIDTGDVDLDGRLDVLGVDAGFPGDFVWHENRIGLRLSVGGLAVRDFLCRNRTRGQSLVVPTAETSIDCEHEGLVVEPGDEIEVFVRGRAL